MKFLFFFYYRNPFVQIIYVLLMSLGYGCYIFTAYPYVSQSWFSQVPFVLLGINIFLFGACSYMNPGVIKKENVDKYVKVFPYDGYMYHEKVYCPTCHLEKPARSKHCGKLIIFVYVLSFCTCMCFC